MEEIHDETKAKGRSAFRLGAGHGEVEIGVPPWRSAFRRLGSSTVRRRETQMAWVRFLLCEFFFFQW